MNEPIPPPVAIPAKQLPRLGDFSLEPPAGYHVTLGSMRRVGDRRQPTFSVAWAEGFPEAWDVTVPRHNIS